MEKELEELKLAIHNLTERINSLEATMNQARGAMWAISGLAGVFALICGFWKMFSK